MKVRTTRPALRWLVPAVAAALAIGGGAAASAITTSDPDLPPRSPAELLADLQTAQVGAFSGTLLLNSDLGLPALPDGNGGHGHGRADLGSLWTGSHTLRVWYDGPERVRMALLGTLSQSDIIRNGPDVWIWESSENKATHLTLPPGAPTHPGKLPADPLAAAEAALAAIDASTEVTVADPVRVAGRDAHQLVIAPRDEASLIREVRVAVDAEHSLPVAVEVYGQGEEPAFEVRFTQISFTAPDPEQFRFNPPPGAEVTEVDVFAVLSHFAGEFSGEFAGQLPEVSVVGEGWTRVLVVALPEELDLGGLEWLLADGQVLSGTLFSVLRTDDGTLLVGAVTPQRLAEVAAEQE